MSTQLQSDTSRANGAKSQGPITAEGRAISSKNAVKHGLTAITTILLDCEDPAQYQEIIDGYVAAHQPASLAEEDLVGDMVAACWRFNRLRWIETVLLNTQMYRQPITADDSPTSPTVVLMADAFKTLADSSRAMALAMRYQARLHRMHERSFLMLRELQRERKAQSAAPAPPATQPDSAAPPLAPSANPVPETQPAPAAPPLRPAACHRKKKNRNEPAVRCAFKHFPLRLPEISLRLAPRATAPRAAQRLSIG